MTVQLLGVPLAAPTGNVIPANVLQSNVASFGGSWLSNPQTLSFTNAVTEGSTLVAVAAAVASESMSVDDTLGNNWTNLSLGNNDYGISYVIGSASGNNTANFYAEAPGINTHNSVMLVLELSNVTALSQQVASSAPSGYVSGIISLDSGEYSFESTTSYDYTWYLNLLYFESSGGDGIILAVAYISSLYGNFEPDDIPGWTLIGYDAGIGVYAQQTTWNAYQGIDVRTVLWDVQTGAPATVWLGLLQDGALIGTPYQIFKGMVDQPTIDVDTQTVSVSLSLENRLTNLQRGNGRRYTSADQNLYYPDDTGFAYVEILNDIALGWGTT